MPDAIAERPPIRRAMEQQPPPPKRKNPLAVVWQEMAALASDIAALVSESRGFRDRLAAIEAREAALDERLAAVVQGRLAAGERKFQNWETRFRIQSGLVERAIEHVRDPETGEIVSSIIVTKRPEEPGA